MMRIPLVVASLAAATFGDPCTQIGNCLDCVDSPSNCGWCSTNVIYEDGKVGTQCVSPSSGDPFTCLGIYSTEECVAGYVCNKETYKCEQTKPGSGATLQTCLEQCVAPAPPGPPPPPGTGYVCEVATGECKPSTDGKGVPLAACKAGCVQPAPPSPPTPPSPPPPPPAKVYVCNIKNFTCEVAPAGTPHATSLAICESMCHIPPPPGPPTPPVPPSPPTPPGPPGPPSPPVPPPPPPAKVYKCDQSTGVCHEVPPGTAGSGSLLVCNETCKATPAPPTPPSGFKCRFSDFTCVPGGTETQADCEKACLGFYVCDKTDFKCVQTNASTPGATSKEKCEDNCAADWVCNKEELQCAKATPGQNGTTRALCESYCVTSYTCQDDLTCKAGPPGSGIPNKTLCEEVCVPSYQCDADTLKCNPVAPSKGTSKDRCELGCVTNYFCNTTWQCTPVPPGQGYRNETACEEKCQKPPPYYQCNYDTYKCDEVPAGSPPPATPNKTLCDQVCVMPPPTPGPPSDLKGLWRAVYVQNGYAAGEYDLFFGDTNITIVSQTGLLLRGDLKTEADETVEISVTVGKDSGKMIKALFQAQGDGAETTYGEFALGAPGGPAPASISVAMTSPGSQVFAMAKCLSQSCHFRMEYDALTGRVARVQQAALPVVKPAVNDPCLQFGTSCQACLAGAPYCGWCSDKVKYQDGTIGTNCAGTALGIEPFICDGTYSTASCPGPNPPPGPTPPGPTPPGPTPPGPTPPGPTPPGPPTPPTPPSPPTPPVDYKYSCNFTSLQCVEGGKQTKQDCVNMCKAPTPVPPNELLGYWRGFQIRNPYLTGEWDIWFTPSVTVLYHNTTELWQAHVQTYAGVYMKFDLVSGPNSGKSYQVMYQKTNMNMLTAITMAFSGLDGPMPGSFDEAMTLPEDSYDFFKCGEFSTECIFVNPHKNSSLLA